MFISKKEERISLIPSRIKLKNIILINFKSYQGFHSIGPFHERLTAVVGPNGSGKSNVIDALLFVFARRASQLRLTKISELIHNSKQNSEIPFTRVNLCFTEICNKESEEYCIIPGSEFIISRVAYHDNKSEYYINNNLCSVSEIANLMNNFNIDIENNRFLILQGEVELISTMKPKGSKDNETGLLEYIEKIVGSETYVAPIDELNINLEKVSERLNKILDRIKVVEKEKDRLEGIKIENDVYHKNLWRQHCLKIIRNSLLIEQNRVNYATHQNCYKRFINHFIYEVKRNGRYETEALEAKSRIDALTYEYENLSKITQHLGNELKDNFKHDFHYRDKIKILKHKKNKLLDKISEDNKKVSESIKTAKTGRKLLEQVQRKVVFFARKLKEIEINKSEKKINSKGFNSTFRWKIQNIKQKLDDRKFYLQTVIVSIKYVLQQNHLLADRHYEENVKLKTTEYLLVKYKNCLITKRKESFQVRNEHKRCIVELNQARYDEKKNKVEESIITESIRKVQMKIKDLHCTIAGRQKTSTVVKELDIKRNKNEIPGIFGRLGDLGTIDALYDSAISTACPALDFILVDTAATAQTCVEYLRNHNIGTATFIILDKQEHLINSMNAKIQTPNSIPRLFDLVSIEDEKYKVAFYFGLRDCLVADNLEIASQIAYDPKNERFRKIVTLNGELIQDSGTISGGGEPNRGRILLNKSKKDFTQDYLSKSLNEDKLKNEIASSLTALSWCRKKMNAVNQLIEQLEKVDQKLEFMDQKIKIEIRSEKEKINSFEKILIDLETQEIPGSRKFLKENGSNKKESLHVFKYNQDEIYFHLELVLNLIKETQMIENQVKMFFNSSNKKQVQLIKSICNEMKEKKMNSIKHQVEIEYYKNNFKKINNNIKKNPKGDK